MVVVGVSQEPMALSARTPGCVANPTSNDKLVGHRRLRCRPTLCVPYVLHMHTIFNTPKNCRRALLQPDLLPKTRDQFLEEEFEGRETGSEGLGRIIYWSYLL